LNHCPCFDQNYCTIAPILIEKLQFCHQSRGNGAMTLSKQRQ
jgi:hypothetical protein